MFATLGFSGLVVALHESTRPGRWYAGPLVALNFALVALSLTRMAVIASLVFALAYALLSPDLRAQWRAYRTRSLLILAAAASALILCWPNLEARMFAGEAGTIAMSERDELWPFYYREFLFSPLFGRGIGAGFIAAADWLPGLTAPHDEYLHYLVIGGVVGFVLIIGGIGLWYRHLLQIASPNDRPCLLALIPAIALYIVTDNLFFYATALPLYAYLSVLLTRPSLDSIPLAALPAEPPASPAVSAERLAEGRIRAALARRRTNNEAVERITSQRSR